MLRKRWVNGAARAGSTRRTRAAGFSGTAAIIWEGAATTTRDRFDAGARSSGTSPRSRKTAYPAIFGAVAASAKRCSTGHTIAGGSEVRVHTFGHGTAGEIELAALVRAAGVKAVADVRSIPKSRAHPHVWAERMEQWVPDLAGASYEWRRDLGGFRKTTPESPNVALRHPSFRGYADYMQTGAFRDALGHLLADAATAPTAIMCSETLWWRCHRRLIAD